MLLNKKFIIISVIHLTLISALWAGDTASFVDLGFSPDGKTYMFGQYGVQASTLKPWAELFVVDVQTNNFVPNGRVSFTQNSPIKAGQDGSGILYQLINSNSSLVSRYGVSFPNQGLPLFISREANPPPYGENIDFRDFISGKSYKAELIPLIEGSGQNVRSSFYIRLESRTANGQTKNYTIGSPEIKRSLIQSYNFKRVLIDSRGESIIFVIEMRRFAENGSDIRYMVEVQRL